MSDAIKKEYFELVNKLNSNNKIGPFRIDTLHFVPETSFTLFENQKGRLPVQL